MAEIQFKGSPIHTSGDLPAVGSAAPDFTLVTGELGEASLADYAGKTLVLNIVPSLDTGVCQASARRFNEILDSLEDVVVANISIDLPFAQGRFCESEGLSSVTNLSTFRSPEFGDAYGMHIVDGPLKGLLARGIVLVKADGTVGYTELVPEIAQEPNYDAVLEQIG